MLKQQSSFIFRPLIFTREISKDLLGDSHDMTILDDEVHIIVSYLVHSVHRINCTCSPSQITFAHDEETFCISIVENIFQRDCIIEEVIPPRTPRNASSALVDLRGSLVQPSSPLSPSPPFLTISSSQTLKSQA